MSTVLSVLTYVVVVKYRRVVRKIHKTTDESDTIRCTAGMGELREEVWIDASGKAVRYNLAFINHHLYAKDNGRVLGYDTSHGFLHRHYAGSTERIDPAPYVEIFDRFLAEVEELKKRKML